MFYIHKICNSSLRRRGVTLIEVVIALAVLAVALAGIIAAMAHTMVDHSITRQETLARDAAMTKLDQARSRNYSDLLNASQNIGSLYLPQPPPTSPTDVPASSDVSRSYFSVDGLAPPQGMPTGWLGGFGRITFDPLAPSSEIMKVRIEISWQSERGLRQFDVSALVAR